MNQRIAAISELGRIMGLLASESQWPGFHSGVSEDEFNTFQELINTHHHSNAWFTPQNIKKALGSWNAALNEENIRIWLSNYSLEVSKRKLTVGIICAGNLPLVGLHDILTVIVTGNKAIIKLSSTDSKLIPSLMGLLVNLLPEISDDITYLEGKLSGFDAVIATGSNNSSRYFNYYFKDVPHIIRKSRTSIAILDGTETEEELKSLGNDIFDYFGLGCRNISKIYLPSGFNLDRIFNALFDFKEIVNHHKYANNYDYNKAVWLLNSDALLDNGFILLKEDTGIASPTGSLYYEYYDNRKELEEQLMQVKEELQCIVGHNYIPFGQSQEPKLWDYADGVDTILFLSDAMKQPA